MPTMPFLALFAFIFNNFCFFINIVEKCHNQFIFNNIVESHEMAIFCPFVFNNIV